MGAAADGGSSLEPLDRSQIAPLRAYRSPALRRYGAATELTLARSMVGNMDGAGNNGSMSRTG